MRKVLYFGRYTSELFLDLGIYIYRYAELEQRNHMGKHVYPRWHNFKIGFLFSPHHNFFIVTPRSVWPVVVHIVRLTAVPLPFDIGFQG